MSHLPALHLTLVDVLAVVVVVLARHHLFVFNYTRQVKQLGLRLEKALQI